MKPVVLFLCALFLSACPAAKKTTGFAEPLVDGIGFECPVTKQRCMKHPETPSVIYKSRTFYFCSREGAERFWTAPEKFAEAPF